MRTSLPAPAVGDVRYSKNSKIKMKPLPFLLSLGILILMQATSFPQALAKPRLEVFKAKRELHLLDAERLVKVYRIALGFNPVPSKKRQGDGATPEGSYTICVKNPKSLYTLSLGISYPGPIDAERGFKSGLISASEKESILKASAQGKTPPWNTKLGGEIFVHGKGSEPDWTKGCIALDDKDIIELYPLIPVGTSITIHP